MIPLDLPALKARIAAALEISIRRPSPIHPWAAAFIQHGAVAAEISDGIARIFDELRTDLPQCVEVIEILIEALVAAELIIVGEDLLGAEQAWPNAIRAKRQIRAALERVTR